MPIAYVLVSADVGSENKVLTEIKKIKNVTEAHTLLGTYDVIAKIEANSMDEIKESVFRNIRQLDKVRATVTLTVM